MGKFHILGALVLILLLCGIARADDVAGERTGRVIGSSVNVREGPGTGHAVLTRAAKGEAVAILEEAGDWLKIRLQGDRIGWIFREYVREDAPSAGEGASESGGTSPSEEGATSPPVTSEQAFGRSRSGGGGGSLLGSVLKWGCLAGAAAVGYLAYDEHVQGNDAYDEYKGMFDSGNHLMSGFTENQAEAKRQDSIDHDGKATTYSIVSGALFGAFLVQALMRHGHSESAGAAPQDPPTLALNPARGEVRAAVVLARF